MLIWAKPVWAADLEEVNIRLERNKSGISPLPILVTVKTGNLEIENNLRILVGNSWNVTSPTISVANLPNGITAWPGIGVNNVLGKNIYFSSGDLDGNLTYGFYIAGGIGNNPIGSTEADRKWKVATGNAETEVKVLVVENDQITITGKVGAKVTDFQLETESSPSGTLNQDKDIEIKLKYGSYLSSVVRPLVVAIEWSKGTVTGQPFPTVDVVGYKIGSASSGYGGVSPVVDLVNRRVYWTISSFPGNLQNEEVSLILKTNSNYTGSAGVNFWVKGTLNGAGVVTVDSQKNLTYQYNPPITPTTVQTPTGSGSSGQTTPGVTPTVTPVVLSPQLSDIVVSGVTSNGVNIKIENSGSVESMRVRYGKSPSSLDDSIVSLNQLSVDLLNIDGLSPGKSYYFKVEVVGKDGKQVKSETYTFRTPEVDTKSKAETNTVVVSSQDNIVTDSVSEKTEEFANVVLPKNNLYSFKINFSKHEEIREVIMLVRDAKVLGTISVYGAEPNSLENVMVGVGDNGYVSQMVSPTVPGYYEVYVKIYDIYGGIKEQKVADLKVLEPIKVVDGQNNGIEGVSVFITRFNSELNLFQPLPSQYKGIVNPGFTDSEGKLSIALSKGKYKAEVTGNGFESKTVEFNLGMNADEGMPVVQLKKTRFRLIGYLGYVQTVIHDLSSYIREFLGNLMSSKRFFSLFGMIQIIAALMMTVEYLYENRKRRGLRPKSLWLFLGEELAEAAVGGTLLLMTFCQMVFLGTMGWIKTWPFLVLAMFSLLLWARSLLKIERYEK